MNYIHRSGDRIYGKTKKDNSRGVVLKWLNDWENNQLVEGDGNVDRP